MLESAKDQDWNSPRAGTDLAGVEIQSAPGPLRSGWPVQGPHVRGFGKRRSYLTGAGHSIPFTSCTSALHLSLRALGAGPGDEIVVPAFTGISARPASHADRTLSHHKNQHELCSRAFQGVWGANECSISLPLFHGATKHKRNLVIRELSSEQL